jgi:hypothetical protein
MGTSVASELLARDIEGSLPSGIHLSGCLLFNGNMMMDRSSLILGQRLLRNPMIGSIAARLSFSWAFRWQLGSVFGRSTPMSPEEGEDQWSLMAFKV